MRRITQLGVREDLPSKGEKLGRMQTVERDFVKKVTWNQPLINVLKVRFLDFIYGQKRVKVCSLRVSTYTIPYMRTQV